MSICIETVNKKI